MNEYAEKIIYGLLTIVGGIFAWAWNKNEKRHDGHDAEFRTVGQQIRIVEQESISRDTITRIENDWRDEVKLLRDERKDNHAENSKRLDKIDEKLDRMHAQWMGYLRQR